MSALVLKATGVVVVGENDEIENERVRSVANDAFARGRVEATQGLEHELVLLREAINKAAETGCRDVASSSRLDADVITRLAADLAEWFLDGVIDADPSLLMQSLQGALAKMAEEVHLVLWVHPRVVDALASDGNLAVDAVRGDASLEIADFRLVADGTMVERRWGDTITKIGPQLAASLDAVND